MNHPLVPVPVSEDSEILLCKTLIFDNLRHLECFFEKLQKVDPHYFRGGLLSVIFSKKQPKSLKTGFFGSQKSRNTKVI